MKIPHIQAHEVVDGISHDDLHRLFAFDPDEFDENRKKLASHYSDFLIGNGLCDISNRKTLLKKFKFRRKKTKIPTIKQD